MQSPCFCPVSVLTTVIILIYNIFVLMVIFFYVHTHYYAGLIDDFIWPPLPTVASQMSL